MPRPQHNSVEFLRVHTAESSGLVFRQGREFRVVHFLRSQHMVVDLEADLKWDNQERRFFLLGFG